MTALADNIRPYIDDLSDNFDFLAETDFIRAKALFGVRLQSIRPPVADTPHIRWINARHPLLTLAFARSSGREVVPLTVRIDRQGPYPGHLGSRTRVASRFASRPWHWFSICCRCGMTIPVAEGTETGIFGKFFIDIGDEQSIENDLSTYSSHLINMKQMLRHADDKSLVMIDEFGTGTEPVIGGAIAEAILAELNIQEVLSE
ncbi:MAG: hypothetical protein MZV63_45380 [Marinilabiliales bacterium]|nr:hypothetical protein [Marinilabiliales bacterium]